MRTDMESIKNVVIVFLLAALVFCSCRSHDVVMAERVNTDIEHAMHESVDSIYVRDSIHVYINGDTVREYRDRVLWRDRFVHDTVFVEKRDSIPYLVEVEKKLTRWQQMKMDAGGYAMICLVVVLFLLRLK